MSEECLKNVWRMPKIWQNLKNINDWLTQWLSNMDPRDASASKNTSFIALIWGFTNFQEMKLICSLFYHRISGRYLANIFFHLTMYGWDSLSSLYTRDIMEIWHIHVSAVLKDYNGTTFIISIRKGKRKKFVPSYFLLILCCEHLQDCWYIKANGPQSSRHQNAWRVGWRGGGPLA